MLHVSEIAEHRVKEVKDELREGDQILVKVLAIEGNRIKLSRKAVLREQRAKLGLPEPGQIGTDTGRAEAAAPGHQPSDDGDDEGEDFDDDGEESADEPNFNRADGAPAVPVTAGGQRPNGPGGQRRPGGSRRRRGGRRPGSGPGGQQGGGNR